MEAVGAYFVWRDKDLYILYTYQIKHHGILIIENLWGCNNLFDKIMSQRGIG